MFVITFLPRALGCLEVLGSGVEELASSLREHERLCKHKHKHKHGAQTGAPARTGVGGQEHEHQQEEQEHESEE